MICGLIGLMAGLSSMVAEAADSEQRVLKVLTSNGVQIHYDYDSSWFPAEWKAAPISASGSGIRRADLGRAIDAVESFLSKYPHGVLSENLSDVYLLGSMSFYGQPSGSGSGDASIYVTVGSLSEGYSEAFVAQCLHSKFVDILIRRYDFPHEKWTAANPASFSYSNDAVANLNNDQVFSQTPSMLKDGFLCRFSQTAFASDVNMMAPWLFTRSTELRNLAERHSRLRTKVEVLKEYYRSIDPSIRFP